MGTDSLASLRHILPETAEIIHGRLWVGGCDLIALAEAYGTPLYVYDAATLDASVAAYAESLQAHYPGPWEIAYAAKAFLCTAIAQWANARGLGLDVVSGGEITIALQAGFPAERMHFHGNNKTEAELTTALNASIGRIVLDNDTELKRLAGMARERQRPVDVWLRLTPDLMVHTHTYTITGRVDTKFGFPLAEGIAAKAAQAVLNAPYLRLKGLHAHLGSQVFDPTPIGYAVEVLLDFAASLRQAGWTLQELSPGGGWGVPYRPEDPPAPVDRYVATICQATVEGCRRLGFELPRLILEPGRSLVARAGLALYRVGAIKRQPNRTYILVDGGLADNPRPALYQARYTALLANRAAEPPQGTVTVAGPYCESGDILISNVALPRAQPGDVLAVPVAGAYQLSMASNYNGARRPTVLWLQQGSARVIQKRESMEDLTRRDHPLWD